MVRRLSMAPEGPAEYDFRQMMGDKPRVSARQRDGVFEVYTISYRGTGGVVFSSESWERAYEEGLRIAATV